MMDSRFEHINDIILEELGINDEVAEKTKELITDIETEYKNGKHEFTIKTVLNGSNVKVFVHFFSFSAKHEYDEFVSNNAEKTDSGSVYYTDKIVWIMLNLHVISGYFDKAKYTEVLQHELSHIFQQTSQKRPYKQNKLYHTSMKYWHSSDNVEKAVSNIIYMSFSYEQDSFANGLYGFLFTNYAFNSNVGDVVAKSEAWLKCDNLKSSIEIVENEANIDKVSEILQEYGITYTKLINIGKITLKKMYRKIARTIIKYKDDMNTMSMTQHTEIREYDYKKRYLI